MAKKKREVPEINSSSTADFLLDYNIYGYRPWFGKTFAASTGKGPEVGRCKEEGTQRIASLLEHAGPVNVRE